MSRIEELIREHCPDGVGSALLVDVVDVIYGCPFESDLFTECPDYMPLIRIRDLKEGLTGTYYSGGFDEKYVVKRGHVVIGMDGEFNIVRWKDRDGLLNQRVCRIESKDEAAFLTHFAYYILGDVLKKIEEGTQASTVKHLSAKVIKKIEIPVPPIEVQREIVRVLDAMCELEAKLQEEMEAREKQFEEYRNQLLSEGEFETKTISDVFTLKNGYTPSKSDLENWTNGFIPWFHMEDIRLNGRVLSDSIDHVTQKGVKKSGLFPAGSLIISTSATIGEYALIECDFLANQRFTILTPKADYANVIDKRFVLHYACHLSNWCKNHINQSNFASVDMTGFKAVPFAVPSIEAQREIVAKLDAFEALIGSLKEEIAARHSQYEHYRDALLAFEKKGA